MIAHTYTYVLLEDVCEHNKLDYDTVMMAISNSDTSFGTNYDTFNIKKIYCHYIYHYISYGGANYSLYYGKKIINLYIKNLISIIYYIYKCQIF